MQLTNPRARVELKWACVPGDPLEELKQRGIDTVSTLDIPMPGWERGNWGTFQILPDGSTELLASPYWDWGAFYVKLAQSILSGDWDALNTSKHGGQAINYWWGMPIVGLNAFWKYAAITPELETCSVAKMGTVYGITHRP